MLTGSRLCEGVLDSARFILETGRVISLIRPVNTPSQAVTRGIGMQPGRRTQHGGFEHIVFETTSTAVGTGQK